MNVQVGPRHGATQVPQPLPSVPPQGALPYMRDAEEWYEADMLEVNMLANALAAPGA